MTTKPHRSPDGTYEMVLKSVIEDPEITADEFRVLLYLASKPDGWQARQEQLAASVNMPPRAIKTALTGLRRRGYLTPSRPRRKDGQWQQGGSTVDKDRVLAGRNHGAENRPTAPPAQMPSSPRSEPKAQKRTDGMTSGNNEFPQVAPLVQKRTDIAKTVIAKTSPNEFGLSATSESGDSSSAYTEERSDDLKTAPSVQKCTNGETASRCPRCGDASGSPYHRCPCPVCGMADPASTHKCPRPETCPYCHATHREGAWHQCERMRAARRAAPAAETVPAQEIQRDDIPRCQDCGAKYPTKYHPNTCPGKAA